MYDNGLHTFEFIGRLSSLDREQIPPLDIADLSTNDVLIGVIIIMVAASIVIR